jgi:hypothetical protein
MHWSSSVESSGRIKRMPGFEQESRITAPNRKDLASASLRFCSLYLGWESS